MKKILIAAALTGAAFNASAAKWIFDDFSVNHGNINLFELNQNGLGETSGTTGTVGSILGNEREAFLEVTTDGSAAPDAFLQVADGNNLSWGNNPGAFSEAELIYDGDDSMSSPTKTGTSFYSSTPNVNVNGLSLDVLNPADLYQGFFFDVTTSDAASSFNYYIQVFEAGGANTQVITDVNPGGVTGYVTIDFDLFDQVDLSNIGAIAFGFQSIAEGADISISSWGVIPEPSMLAVFGASLLGFGFVGRRRKPENN